MCHADANFEPTLDRHFIFEGGSTREASGVLESLGSCLATIIPGGSLLVCNVAGQCSSLPLGSGSHISEADGCMGMSTLAHGRYLSIYALSTI